MHTTDNYQLCQWESADRILMESFNGDNQKIDAALKASADAIAAKADADTLRYVKICETVMESSAGAVSLDVSSVDFSQYLKVELFIHAPDYTGDITIRINHLSSGYNHTAVSGSVDGRGSSADFLALLQQKSYGMLSFFTPHPSGRVGCISISTDGSGSYEGFQSVSSSTWGNLSSFDFAAETSAFPVGSRFILYGLKA